MPAKLQSRVARAARVLENKFGRPRRQNRRRPDLVGLLIHTILSQNTNDINRDRAYDSLTGRYTSWEALLKAKRTSLESAIRTGGLARQKSATILAFLKRLDKKNGALNLDFLVKMNNKEIYEMLCAINGIGVKTVSILLCFGLGRDVFPVDTHVNRTCTRLRFAPEKSGPDKTHRLMSNLVPKGKSYSFHLNLIRLGRTICIAGKPRCSECPLKRLCPHYKKPVKQPAALKRALDEMRKTFDRRYLRSDPLEYVRRYKDRRDREVAAFIAASVSYGNVGQIRRSIEDLFWRMKPGPYEFTMKSPPALLLKKLKDFRHRFNSGRDVACMIRFLRDAIRRYGSIEAAFTKHFNHTDADIGPALAGFVEETLACNHSPFYPGKELPGDAGVRRFFSSPRSGSACKRLNLFLRWVVRHDNLDLGLWKTIPASKLVIPLDTHIARTARHIGLTRRKTANWKTALEITEALKQFDPNDPVKYDFSLARPGILGLCRTRRCDLCAVRKSCKGAK